MITASNQTFILRVGQPIWLCLLNVACGSGWSVWNCNCFRFLVLNVELLSAFNQRDPLVITKLLGSIIEALCFWSLLQSTTTKDNVVTIVLLRKMTVRPLDYLRCSYLVASQHIGTMLLLMMLSKSLEARQDRQPSTVTLAHVLLLK